MITTAVFDLETTALTADVGIILCACIESSTDPGNVKTFRSDDLNPKWDQGKRGDDTGVIKAIAKELLKHDVIVAHNGSRFDVPFLRTRMLRFGMGKFPDLKMVDPCSIAYRKFRLRSNSLAVVLDHLGVAERKTPLDMSTWADAMHNGSRKSMNKIVEHCIADVHALSAVLDVVKPYVKILDDRGSSL